MKSLHFIAVVYNNISDTYSLCKSLINQTPGDYDLLLTLVDNSDDIQVRLDIDVLAKKYNFVKLLRPKKNIGYFPAISLALSLIDRSFDYVIAGNNDLLYSNEFCLNLSRGSYEDNIMLICPDVVTFQGIHQNPHHKYRLNLFEIFYFDLFYSNFLISLAVSKFKKIITFFMKIFRHSTLSVRGSRIPQFIDQGVGAIYIFMPHFLSAIDYKLYYPSFLYAEEACISWQVRNIGGKIFYDPALRVLHADSATLSKKSDYLRYSYARDSYWKIRDKL
jgi:GT2 family glycosyltransferase